jgi:hypothetical protein
MVRWLVWLVFVVLLLVVGGCACAGACKVSLDGGGARAQASASEGGDR